MFSQKPRKAKGAKVYRLHRRSARYAWPSQVLPSMDVIVQRYTYHVVEALRQGDGAGGQARKAGRGGRGFHRHLLLTADDTVCVAKTRNSAPSRDNFCRLQTTQEVNWPRARFSCARARCGGQLTIFVDCRRPCVLIEKVRGVLVACVRLSVIGPVDSVPGNMW